VVQSKEELFIRRNAFNQYKLMVEDYNTYISLSECEYGTPEITFDFGLENIPNNLLSDNSFLLECFKYDSCIFEFLGDELKNDIDFLCSAIEINPCILHNHFNQEFLNSQKFVQKINHYIRNFDGYFLKYTNLASKKNEELILAGLKTSEYAFKYAHKSLKSNYDFVISAAKVNGKILRFYWSYSIVNPIKINIYPHNFYFDRNLTLTVVKNCGTALKFVAPKFKKDSEIVKVAIEQNKFAKKYTDIESI